MSVGTRQFLLPADSKSSFLHGGRIASVIKELQGGDKHSAPDKAAASSRSSMLKRESNSLTRDSSRFSRMRESRDSFFNQMRTNSRSRDSVQESSSGVSSEVSHSRSASASRSSLATPPNASSPSSPPTPSSSTSSRSSRASRGASPAAAARPPRVAGLPRQPVTIPPPTNGRPPVPLPISEPAVSASDTARLEAKNSPTMREVGEGPWRRTVEVPQINEDAHSDNPSLDLSLSFSESEGEERGLISFKNSAVQEEIAQLQQRYRPPLAIKSPSGQFALQPMPQPHQASSRAKEEVTVKKMQIRSAKPEGLVGFASLPHQVYRKAVRKGFEFNLMVVGESGLGKSTLVNSMFLTDIYSSSYHTTKPLRTLEVNTHAVLLEEGGVNLRLTVVDTPGFGDAVNNSECWLPVAEYIENQFDKFLEAEQRVHRTPTVDSRVHACLYFIAPSGHGLKSLDIQAMQNLHDKVNIIPVIGKSDACTKDEIKQFKSTILRQLNEQNINIYDFPLTEDPQVDWMREQLPFAVVGSNTIIEDEDGRRVRGRSYPWGTVNIEDRQHCDFTALKLLLLSHHMQDLKDVTSSTHYETYRCRKLTNSLEGVSASQLHPLAQLEKEGSDHIAKVERMQNEMEEVFRRKVAEKAERMRRHEEEEERQLDQDRKQLDQDRQQLTTRRQQLQEEVQTWSSLRNLTYRQKSVESLSGKKKKYGLDKIALKFGRN